MSSFKFKQLSRAEVRVAKISYVGAPSASTLQAAASSQQGVVPVSRKDDDEARQQAQRDGPSAVSRLHFLVARANGEGLRQARFRKRDQTLVTRIVLMTKMPLKAFSPSGMLFNLYPVLCTVEP